jgi:hypothetical protein
LSIFILLVLKEAGKRKVKILLNVLDKKSAYEVTCLR